MDEQKPVVTPQLTRAASSNGMSSSIFTQDHSEMIARCENVPSTHMPPRSSPFWWNRKVPSTRQPADVVHRLAGDRLGGHGGLRAEPDPAARGTGRQGAADRAARRGPFACG